MNTFSAGISFDTHLKLLQHLLRADGQEDLCFATYNPSSGKDRVTGIVYNIILPDVGERQVHGNVSFNPKYLERSLEIAHKRNEGLVFLHSHPYSGWQGMSNDDIIAEDRMSKAAYSVTGLPLLGMTAGTDGAWSGRFWLKDNSQKRTFVKTDCQVVRVVGKQLLLTFHPDFKPNTESKYQDRTISAWGESKQDDLSRIKICIVGVGSVGSIIAEILARMGIFYIKLIDPDIIKNVNLDRTVHATGEDVGKYKVELIAERIRKTATSKNFKAVPIIGKLNNEKILKEVLDCDAVFSCVDRPWPRQIMNFIAYAHLIPVIDGGIMVRTNKTNTKMLGAEWRAHTAGYDRACLECIGQYSQYQVGLEKEGFLDNPEYIEGAPELKNIIASQNVFPFSVNVASLEVLQFLNMFIAPCAVPDIGQQLYHFVTGTLDKSNKRCSDACFFKTIIGKGDNSSVNPC